VLYSIAKDEPIEVEGRIQSGSYEKDGKKIYTQDLVVERFKNRNSELDEWMK
jgi:single-stranded DNA-binding protein